MSTPKDPTIRETIESFGHVLFDLEERFSEAIAQTRSSERTALEREGIARQRVVELEREVEWLRSIVADVIRRTKKLDEPAPEFDQYGNRL